MKIVHKINCMNCKHFWQTGRNVLLLECPICGNGVLNRLDQLRNYPRKEMFKQLRNAKLKIIGD